MVMADGMIELDTDRGRQLGFTSDHFAQGSYLWKTDDYIYISFIESKRKGNFRELAETILAAGLGVKVPTPLVEMERIVRKAGYRHTVEPHDLGTGESVDVWVMESGVGKDTCKIKG